MKKNSPAICVIAFMLLLITSYSVRSEAAKKEGDVTSHVVSICDLAKYPNQFYGKVVRLKTTLGATLRQGYFFYDSACPKSHINVSFSDDFMKNHYQKFFRKVLKNSHDHNQYLYDVIVLGEIHISASMGSSKTSNTFFISRICKLSLKAKK